MPTKTKTKKRKPVLPKIPSGAHVAHALNVADSVSMDPYIWARRLSDIEQAHLINATRTLAHAYRAKGALAKVLQTEVRRLTANGEAARRQARQHVAALAIAASRHD